jgi:nicotinamide phosphoribosyltransferase
MFTPKPLHFLDFYKTGHKPQYPNNTEVVYSNMTPRSNNHFNWKQEGNGYVILWGMRGLVQEYLIDLWNLEFFQKDREVCVKAFERLMKNCVDPEFNADHIRDLHNLGYLPLVVKSLPEGSKVPIGVPLFTAMNTLNEFYWLTNLIETAVSTELWKRVTVATIAFEYFQIFKTFSAVTCDNDEHVPFQGHDFSARGLGSFRDWATCNSGHLLSSAGTDIPLAIDYLEEYYDANIETELVGCSIPATEHSVMCMGSKDGEEATVERLLKEIYPSGLFSAVLDTWDFFKVLTEMLPRLKDSIMSREGKFVVRPDSGDPADIICGFSLGNIKGGEEEQYSLNEFAQLGHNVIFRKGKYFKAQVFQSGVWLRLRVGEEVPEAEVKGAIEILWDIFGGTINSKGFKVLDPHIGLIYGDSITLDRADDILTRLKDKGFASSNVVFGIGSYTYQFITRDTFGMAMKATAGVIGGELVEIFKDPATDDGTKKSAKGLLRVDLVEGNYVLKDECTFEESNGGELTVLFEDSKLLKRETFTEIKQRVQAL